MRKVLLPLISLAVLLLAGCGDSPKKKALGVWKLERSMLSDVPVFIEITEAKMIQNGNADDALDIVIEEKDGRAVVRKAGTEDVYLLLSFADDKTVTAESPFLGKQTLTPSSKEEMQSILFPSPERLVGYWTREVENHGLRYHDVYEFGKDFITRDGRRDAVEITSGMGAYRITGSDRIFSQGRLRDDDTLAFGNSITGGMTLKRTSREEAEKFSKERQELPDRVVGLWVAESSGRDAGRYDAPEFMEISRDAIVTSKGGEETRREGRLTLSDGLFALIAPDGEELLLLQQTDPDRLQAVTRGFGFSRLPSYRRAAARERDSAQAAYDAAGDAVLGIWRKENARSDVKTHPFLEITRETFRIRDKEEPVSRIYGKGDYIYVETGDGSRPYRISVKSDEVINLDSGDWQESGDYRKSAAGDRDAFMADRAAIPDRIIGHWRSVKGDEKSKNFVPLVIERERMSWAGASYAIEIRPKSETEFELVNPQGGGVYAKVTLQKNGTLFFDPDKYENRGAYDRSTAAEITAIMAGGVPLPAVYAGYWVSERQEGINVKYSTLLVREGEIVRNGYAEPMRVVAGSYSPAVVRSDIANYQIAKFTLEYDNRDSMRVSYQFGGDVRYRRAEQEEYEKALASDRIDVEALYGEWFSEEIKRNAVPRAAIAFIKGGQGQWPVVLNSLGLVVKKDQPEQGVIPGIFDLTGKGVIILRGGEKLDSRLAEITILDDRTIKMKEFKFLHRDLTYTKR